MNSEGMYGAFTEMLHSVSTEQPAFERVFGAPLFDFLGQNPQHGAVFARAMGDFDRAATLAAAEPYDWSDLRRVVDVGGGTGTLISRVLEHHHDARGVLFDLPEVITAGHESLMAAKLDGRCELVAGDFFESVPPGGDAYVLRGSSTTGTMSSASRSCAAAARRARPGDASSSWRRSWPPGDEPHFGKVLDVAMLVLTEGRERTELEHAELFEAAGYRLTPVLGTARR